jgi:arabinofuranosyltransferase
MLAGASWVSGLPLPEVSLFLGVLFGALTVLLVFLWGYREISAVSSSRLLSLGAALVAPVLLCLAPGFAFYSASGLEVGLFSLLLTGGLYLLCQGSSSKIIMSGSVVLGLAAITRPEGALALAFGAGACALIPKGASPLARLRRLLLAGVPGAAVILSFTAWRLYYYGALLPNTAYAKAGGLENAERWGLQYVVDAAQGNWFVIAWLVALAGAALDRRFFVRSLAVLAIVPAWCAYLAYVGGDYMPFYRLIVPLLPVILTVGVAGFARLFAFPGPEEAVLTASRRAIVASILAVALLFPFLAHLPEQFELEQAKKEQWQGDKADRKEVVAWFREHDPNALVAANGVGVLGYYTDLRIIDMLGLNDGHIARHGNKEPEFLPGHQAGDGEYVLSREPDYIMLAGGVNPPYKFVSVREIARSPEFQKNYHHVKITLEDGSTFSMFKRN